MTYGIILRRGVIAGLLAGVVAAVFVGLVATDSIDEAIQLESTSGTASGHTHAEGGNGGAAQPEPDGASTSTSTSASEPLFSQGQQVVGGLGAAVIYGIVVGVIFATVFAAVRHLLTVRDESTRVLLLAAVGYAATALLPALKYPPNPPGVGDPATVNERTVLYFTFLAASIALVAAVGLLYRQLAPRIDRSAAIVVAGVLAVSAGAALLLVWPASGDSVPAEFPAQLLWDFRIESLTTLTIVWCTLGLAMGWLSRTR